MTDLLEKREYYQPFEYQWAYDKWMEHESQHWLGYEVPLHQDVKDWNQKLTEEEKNLLTQIFRFFTQADIDVANGYTKHFLPLFANKPEITMMLTSFAAREAVHIDAYARLIETIGMDEKEYKAFKEYEAMKDKHDFVDSFNTDTPLDIAKTLAVYSAFTEGMQLFGSFIILLNFSRFNKMKNMCNIVTWSIRDESMHVEGMLQLFKTFVEEQAIDKDLLAEDIQKIMLTMVDLEDKFIDLCFKESPNIEGLTPNDVKAYIRFIANRRVTQLGLNDKVKLFKGVDKNPLPWVDFLVYGEEHANFFEQKSTFYSKGMVKGTLDDIDW